MDSLPDMGFAYRGDCLFCSHRLLHPASLVDLVYYRCVMGIRSDPYGRVEVCANRKTGRKMIGETI